MPTNILEQRSMLAGQSGAGMAEQKTPLLGVEDETDGIGSTAPPAPKAASSKRLCIKKRGLGEFVEEVVGTPPPPSIETQEFTTSDTGNDTEIANAGSESTDAECAEATFDQYEAAEAAGESAVTDLAGAGYEMAESMPENVALEEFIPDAGDAAGAPKQEFLPFLASLAPTLISTAGPIVAKAVVNQLTPHAKKALRRLPGVVGPATKVITSTIRTSGGSFAKGALQAGLGASNVLGIVGKLFEVAEQTPTTETDQEVDPAFVEFTAQMIESILGTDDRVRITNTTDAPWRYICALRIHFAGAIYRGTGFFVGPRAVVTAGHCVYMHGKGWAQRIEVIPACNGAHRPYGQAVSTSFRSVTGWVQGRKPDYDYGCVVLPPGSFGGANIGRFGFANFTPPVLVAQPAVLAGYPGDKPFAELWGMARRIKTVTERTLMYEIDTMGGQSGAPVYIKRSGKRYVVGIHNYGGQQTNSATRVNAPVYQNLLNWSRI